LVGIVVRKTWDSSNKLSNLLAIYSLTFFGTLSSFDLLTMENKADSRLQLPKKVWTTLITNTKYLSGLLTLDYSLKKAGSKYPLVALYTETFPDEGHRALRARNIPAREIPYLLPSVPKEYAEDPRFYDCWSKLAPFSLTEYDRVVQMDSDMLVLQNMDELMEIELDGCKQSGDGQRVFAASHACACNPLKKPHYPEHWIPENCAFTTQHDKPDEAQKTGAPPTAGISSPNGGLVVVVPSQGIYDKILQVLKDGDKTANYDFADQALLGDVFYGRWVALPYVYNALKTLRWEGVHQQIWRDGQVKNIHYILSPKPWDEKTGKSSEETHQWWHKMNASRLAKEESTGIKDGF
jgi:Glycosyl transferase family 8